MTAILVKPLILPIACTRLIPANLKVVLTELGFPDWDTDAPSDAEKLVEFGGKLCYLSFALGENENLTRVRDSDNRAYLRNIAKERHTSVMEHGTVSFALINVSRIFTHEQVRHRVGVAYSETSYRFVISKQRKYTAIPDMIAEWGEDFLLSMFTYADRIYEAAYNRFYDPSANMHQKKTLTSRLRRFLPEGRATNLLLTANHAALRYMIEKRTDGSAEEEIAYVYRIMYSHLQAMYPNLYSDGVMDGNGSIKFWSK